MRRLFEKEGLLKKILYSIVITQYLQHFREKNIKIRTSYSYSQVPNCRGGSKLHFSETLHTHFHLLTPPPNYVFHAKSHLPNFIGDPPYFRKTMANLP